MSEEVDDKELISVGYSSSLPTDEAAVSDAAHTTGKVLESSSAASLFTECRMMKYRNKFFELVEELRLRRDVNDQNEKKLCELLSLKHKLTQDIEKQTQQLNEVLESHSHLEEEAERKCNEQLKQLEEEKVKLKYLFEGKEKEFQALKDEIRALHMIKYNLEKKLSEQEYTLQVLNVSQENYHSQLSQMEQQCVGMEAKVNEVTKLLDTLESNVREAVQLNGRLATANDHQQCVIDSYKKELDTYQKDCIKLKAKLKAEEVGIEIKKSTNIDQQLRVEREVTHQLQEQLSDVRVEYCTVLKSLKEAHTLIDKHIDTAKESSIRESSLKERVSELSNEVEELKGQLVALEEESVKEKQSLIAESNQHKKELSDLRQRLSALQGDYASLQLSNEELESEKKHLIDSKTENECILDDTMKQLNVAKEEIQITREKYLCIEKERDELKISKHNGENKCDKEVQCHLALEDVVLHKRSPLSQDLLESPPLKRLKSSSNDYGQSETPSIPSVEAQVQDAIDQIIEAATTKFIEPSTEALMKQTVVEDTFESVEADENIRRNEVGEINVIDVSPAPMATSIPSDVTQDNIIIQKITPHTLTLMPDDKATSKAATNAPSVDLASDIKASSTNNFPTLSKSSAATDTVTVLDSNGLIAGTHFKAQITKTKLPHATSTTAAPNISIATSANTSISNAVSAQSHSKTLESSEVEIMFSDNDDDDEDLIDTQLSKEIERAHSLLLNDRLKKSKYHKNKTIIK